MDVKEKVQHKEENKMGQNVLGPCCCEADACTVSASCGTASVCVCAVKSLFLHIMDRGCQLFVSAATMSTIGACMCTCVCLWVDVCVSPLSEGS